MSLDPGWIFTGTVLGPDGKPMAGARRLDGVRWRERAGMKTAGVLRCRESTRAGRRTSAM